MQICGDGGQAITGKLMHVLSTPLFIFNDFGYILIASHVFEFSYKGKNLLPQRGSGRYEHQKRLTLRRNNTKKSLVFVRSDRTSKRLAR